MMKMEERSKLIQQGVWICPPADKCPYYPGVVPAEHSDLLPTEASGAVPAPITSAPARIVASVARRTCLPGKSGYARFLAWAEGRPTGNPEPRLT
jgi:hypothetical protein